MKLPAFTIILALFSCSHVYCQADTSILDNLPFGIKIGNTKAEEIEARGVCIEQIPVRENRFRCRAYDISGNFLVHMSQNETVRLLTWNSAQKFPSSWTRNGLEMGMSKSKFLQTIKSFGAMRIVEEKDLFYESNNDLVRWTIQFETEENFYEALVYELDGTGLSELSVTELY